MKISTGSGNYLKPSEAKRGSIIEVLNEGEIEVSDKYTYEDGSPKKSIVFEIKYENETKKMRMNKSSKVAMVEAFGDESQDWIGKKARIIVMPTRNGDNKMIVLDPVIEEEATSTKELWND